MKAKKFLPGLLGVLFMTTATLAMGQSLGDVARQQREKSQKEAKKPAKLFTNDNLPARPAEQAPTVAGSMAASAATPPAGPQVANAPPPSAPSAENSPASAQAPPAEEKKPEDKKKTKDYWQGRFKPLRARLARAQEVQQLAEDELNMLRIQQARELAPTVQNTIGQKIADKTAEVEAKRQATAQVQKELDTLEQAFKDSGAPEDWGKTE